MNDDHNILRLVAFGLSALAVVLAAWLAQPAALQAESGLPDRPRPVGLPTRLPGPEDMGAYIALQIEPAPGRPMWTEVAWQDGDGEWHSIPGWSGLSRPAGDLRWYVERAQLGNGPFRWSVHRRFGAPPMGVSEPFMLPELSQQVQNVIVSIVPTPTDVPGTIPAETHEP